MNDFNTSYIGLRPDLLKYIPDFKMKILDLGCATGTNAKFIKHNEPNSSVIGVEYDENMAQEAKEFCEKVFIGNLDDPSFLSKLKNSVPKVDIIICGDILEHLKNPEAVLVLCKSLLRKKGKIVLSVPNIQHLELFIQVYIKGTFPRNSRGIFDSTHVRWFTKKDCKKLINSAGFNIDIYEPKFRSRDALNSKFNWIYYLLKIVNSKWVTFQHIYVCSYEK